MDIQKFTIAKDETAVLQVKFMTAENDIVFINENENAIWTVEDEEVIEILSSNFDGSNYNVTVNPKKTGLTKIYAKGTFLDIDGSSQSGYKSYEFIGTCEVEVREGLVRKAFFTLSHRTPKNI